MLPLPFPEIAPITGTPTADAVFTAAFVASKPKQPINTRGCHWISCSVLETVRVVSPEYLQSLAEVTNPMVIALEKSLSVDFATGQVKLVGMILKQLKCKK